MNSPRVLGQPDGGKAPPAQLVVYLVAVIEGIPQTDWMVATGPVAFDPLLRVKKIVFSID